MRWGGGGGCVGGKAWSIESLVMLLLLLLLLFTVMEGEECGRGGYRGRCVNVPGRTLRDKELLRGGAGVEVS